MSKFSQYLIFIREGLYSMEFKSKRAEGIYRNLEKQIRGVAKHNRQGSYETRDRYFAANQRFCKFLAEEYGVQKFANIQDKHIEAYIKDMQSRDLAASTIKTDLGAIRFYHDKCDYKHEISPNQAFELERRSFGGVDRAWSDREYNRFKEVCSEKGYERVRDVSVMARTMGLRIHECTEISRADAEKALRDDQLYVTGKGGKPRYVPLSAQGREVLIDRLEEVKRGDKVFVEQGEKTHLVIKQIQNTINRTRGEWQDTRGADEVNRSFHGLRHTYAREQYNYCIAQGMSEYKARIEVSQLLGHERDEVTRIYLAK